MDAGTHRSEFDGMAPMREAFTSNMTDPALTTTNATNEAGTLRVNRGKI